MISVAAALLILTSGATCDPRQVPPERTIGRNYDHRRLQGVWDLRVSVRGPFIADTVISGPLVLRAREGTPTDSVTMRVSPVLGFSDIELEFLSGMPPFRTFVASRDRERPGIESRRDDEGFLYFAFGNPTALTSGTGPIVLRPASGATFVVLHADGNSFSGRWSVDTGDQDRPQGLFCAVRA